MSDEATQIFSGDWLVAGGPGGPEPARWAVGYAGIQSGAWSGGVQFKATKEVMAQIIEDNTTVENSDKLLWDQDHKYVVWLSKEGLGDGETDYVSVIEPDDDGLYETPGWSWYSVERDRVDKVVGDPIPPEPPSGPMDVVLCLRLHLRRELWREGALESDKLWSTVAHQVLEHLPGTGLADWKLETDPTKVFQRED